MKIIHKPYSVISNILKNQRYVGYVQYRKISYLVDKKIEDGVLLYHTFTREILLLTEQEYESMNSGNMETEVCHYLIERWFLVPEDFDDRTFYYVMNEFYVSSSNIHRFGKLNLATVFTTTACNARCPYCYEHGVTAKTMTREIALDAAKYIQAHAGNHVHLKWFGGEPLINPEAIRIICEYLAIHGVNFNSSMTTNGYLLNQFDIQQIKNLWRLDNVQITLDGMQDTYNATKMYANGDENAFNRVLKNIEYMNSLGVYVSIRLNLSGENAGELQKLIKYLAERFSLTSGISAYTNPLFEGCGNPPHTPTAEEREKIYADYVMLEEQISRTNLSPRYQVSGLRHCQCMADNGHSSCVLPDGRLSICEHHCDDEIFGTIWDDDSQYDMRVFDRWAEKEERTDQCADCFYYPQCFRLKRCETNPPCTGGLRNFYRFALEQQAMRAYKQYNMAVEQAVNEDNHVLMCRFNNLIPD